MHGVRVVPRDEWGRTGVEEAIPRGPGGGDSRYDGVPW